MSGQGERRQMTARDWLLVVGGGVVIVLFGQVLLGVLVGLVGLGGLAWRLLENR